MSDRPVISVENLGKTYRISHQGEARRYEALRDVIADKFGRLFRPRRTQPAAGAAATTEDFWALKDVSFEVRQGEVIGIIGRNGAGKSTLLKILSRITEPTEGRVRIRGRVASLLEVGTGFHPELTGRENIYLNGAILGMSRAEIRRKFDEIVAFAEVEKFLDTPVKRYSSGMYVRLAFAVAAHLDPEILIVDEVLAVGDAQFQKKCLGKMQDVARGGRTVLFVSHNMAAVIALCTSAILIGKGRIEARGPISDVLDKYWEMIRARSTIDLEKLRLHKDSRDLQITSVSLRGGNDHFLFGQDLVFELGITATRPFTQLSVGCSIFQRDDLCVGSLFTSETFDLAAGESKQVCLSIRQNGLVPGSYSAGFSIGHGGITSERKDYDVIIGTPTFHVTAVKAETHEMVSWGQAWGAVCFKHHHLAIEPGSGHRNISA